MPGLMSFRKKPRVEDELGEDDSDETTEDAEGTQEPEEDAAPAPPARDAPAPAEDEGADEPPDPGLSPEENPDEQTAYNTFVKNGMRLIYPKDDTAAAQILESLDGGGNPVEGLANTLAMVVTRLIDSAEKGNAALPADVILYGAGELLEQLADLSKQSGGHAYSDDEKLSVAKAMLQATAPEGGAGPGGPPGAPPGPPAGRAQPRPAPGPPGGMPPERQRGLMA